MRPTLIVGASVAGMRTAKALRMGKFGEPIVIVEAETYAPYDKPPLSKEVLDAERGGELVPLLPQADLDALEVDLRLGVRATGVDVDRRILRADDGTEVDFANLVIACGLRPRTLPGAERMQGVYTIRSAVDALAIHRDLQHARRAVVIGAGFIGAEFAAAARARGIHVSIVEIQSAPMAQLLGTEVGAMMAKLHEANGVEVHTEVSVSSLVGGSRVRAVGPADGRELPADIVVIGIGATPATEWLESSTIPIADGVRCDENLRVIGAEDIYAVGDVARRPHELYRSEMRIEHWTNANDHASIVAAGILKLPRPAEQVPYVWSDQYGKRIQIVGRPQLGTLATLTGDGGSLAAIYADEQRTLVGALTINDARTMMKCRKAIARRLSVDEAR